MRGATEIDGTTGYYVGFSSQGHVNDGGPHHITLARRGAYVRLYIDNALDTSVNGGGIANIVNSTSLTAGSSACIGCDGTAYFVGVLDEIQLWQGDNNPFYSSRNWPPLTYYNVQNPATPWTNGLLVDSASPAKLAFNYVEADGSFNLKERQKGSVLGNWYAGRKGEDCGGVGGTLADSILWNCDDGINNFTLDHTVEKGERGGTALLPNVRLRR